MHPVIIDDVHYVVDARMCALLHWLIEHASELPASGNLQINLTAGRFTPQTLKTFEPVKIIA